MDHAADPRLPADWAILRGWILYDGRCGLCRQGAARWEVTLRPRGFVFVSSLDEERRMIALGRTPDELTELKLIRTDGRVFGGSRAIGEIARHVWWGRPFGWLTRMPLTAPLAAWAYRRVANNRHRLSRLLGYTACTDACAARS